MRKHIILFYLIILSASCFAQTVTKTVGIVYTAGAPTHVPAAKVGSQVAIDTATWKWYEYNGSAWIASGDRVQSISGCSAPNYTPTKYQSRLVINACTAGQGGPELYYYTGSAWLQINEGQTYTAGSGISIAGGQISASDISPTNEIQTLSIAGQTLSLSNGGGSVSIPAAPGVDTTSRTIHTDRYTPNIAWKFANDITSKENKKILLLGDSWFDNGNYLQYYLYERFNVDDYVVGGVFTTTTQNNTGVKSPVFTGTWSSVSFSASYPQSYSGYDGYVAVSSSAGAMCSFETQTTASAPGVEKFTNAKIFALNNSAVYRIRVDGGSWTTVTTTTGNTVNIYSISGLSVATHKLDVEVVSGTLNLYGGVFSNPGTKGVTFFKAGHTGSKTREWKDLVRSANWRKQIQAMDPDLVFLHLGLNDNGAGVGISTYSANMDTIVASLQSYFADSATIVIVAPVEPISSYRVSPSVLFRDKCSRLSVEKQTAFISFYDLYNRSYSWAASNNLFTQPDGIHPAAQGGTYLANEINILLKGGANYVPASGLVGAVQFSDGKLLSARDSLRVTTLPIGLQIGTGVNASQGYRLTLRGDAAGIGNLKVLNASGQKAAAFESDGSLVLTSNPGTNVGLTLNSLISGNTGALILRPKSTAVGGPADFEIVNNGRLFLTSYQLLLTGGGGLNITGAGLFSGLLTGGGVRNTSTNYYFTPSNSAERWLSNDSPSSAKAGVLFKPTGAWNRQDIGFAANNIADGSAVSSANALAWVRSAGYFEIANSASIGSSAAPSASAILDLASTTKGMLPPRMTTAQRNAISSPATGLTLYCTDCTATDSSTGVMQTYNGSTWKNHW